MGAVQAQDRPGALWAIGLRTRRARQADVERAVERGRIVRTWPMRNTLHFVAAEDAHGMVALLAARALQRMAGRERELGLTRPVLARSRRILARALAGGQRLTRPEAYRLLEARGVKTSGQRGIHLLGHLAHEGLLCFGPMEGKQRTFVLLDEWVPPPRAAVPRDDAVAELARRYATSHGPASARDLAWWSGLTLTDARAGLAAARGLRPAGLEGMWTAARPAALPPPGQAHLLPAFDELFVAYKDRTAGLARVPPGRLSPSAGLLGPVVVVDGQAVGTWTRALGARGVRVDLRLVAPLAKGEEERVAAAAQRYADFLGAELALRMS